MRNKRAVLTGLLALFFLSAGVAGAATVRLEATNATKGEGLSSYPVKIRVLGPAARPGEDPEVLETLEMRTGPDGSLSAEVEAPPGSAISAEASFRGVSYRSEPVVVKTAGEELSVRLPVYDITDSGREVFVSSRQITITPGDGGFVRAYETLVVENRGDRTYIGKWSDDLDVTRVLHIPMPEGYMLSGVGGVSGDRVLTLGGAVVTREEIRPGSHEIRLGYSVTSHTGFFDFALLSSRDAPETLELTVLFAEAEGWRFKPGGLESAGQYSSGGNTYRVYRGEPGNALRMKIYGPGYVATGGVWAVTMALVLVAALSVLVLFKKPLRLWHLARERSRLEAVLEDLQEEAGEKDARGYYAPLARTIEGRLREIDERLGTGHA